MPQENNGAPIIPAGTQPTAFGSAAFNAAGGPSNGQPRIGGDGQGQPAPASIPQQQAPAQNAPLDGTTFAELAEKKGFKTPDDLAKAYANLESHNKKVEMSADDIIKMVQAGQQVQPVVQPAVPVVHPQNPDDQAIQIVQSIVDSRMKPLQNKVELQDLFLKNPDAKDYAMGIAKAVQENPGLSWDNALKIAKYDAIQPQAVQQGRQEAYKNIQQKQEFMAGASVPTQRSGPDVRSVIKDRSIPFVEVDRIVKEALTAQGL